MPRPSIAPHLMRFSTARLLRSEPCIRRAKVLQRDKRAVFRPLRHDLADEAAADVFHGPEAEADAVRLHGELILRGVDVRVQQADAHKSRQSAMYPAVFVELSSTDVSSAAIYSRE